MFISISSQMQYLFRWNVISRETPINGEKSCKPVKVGKYYRRTGSVTYSALRAQLWRYGRLPVETVKKKKTRMFYQCYVDIRRLLRI